jgi:hypothetical protein
MNFFQLQNKLFYSKKDTAGYLDAEGEEVFVPFLMNRWLSFYDKGLTVFTNETLNKYCGVFDDKQRVYRYYFNIIPRLRFKRISYIKKIKKNKEEAEEECNLLLIAKSNNISVRELKQYMDFYL